MHDESLRAALCRLRSPTHSCEHSLAALRKIIHTKGHARQYLDSPRCVPMWLCYLDALQNLKGM